MTDRHCEIVLPEPDLKNELRRKTRRDFLIAGLTAAGGIGAYEWIRSAKPENDVPWPERRVLDLNGKLAHSYLNDSHLMPTYSRKEVGFLKPNGDVGVEGPVHQRDWRLQVSSGENSHPLNLSLSDIKALPKIDMITRFCCIEGWSVVTWWSGARFSDFTKKFFPPDRRLPDFVYMATPGEDYYVGLDMKSAMHPQTLLAYEQNDKPLEDRHGAPLRLAIPVKYGIKNIKRIGMIRYTNTRPDDYWADEGYDWFAGL